MAWLQYSYMDQNHNMSGAHQVPAYLNDDKEIRTNFYTGGAEYMFNRDWGISGQVPFDDRFLRTTADDGSLVNSTHAAFGDAIIEGIYTGLSPNMSTGLTFGLKLPTGQYKYAGFDRDTETGTGSTDTRLGAYHLDQITGDGAWNWFAQGVWDHPVETSDHYRPGDEIDIAAGVYYAAWEWNGVRISPIGQLIGSQRWHDSGT